MKKHFLHGNHINTLKWLLFALFVLMNIGGSVAQVGKVSITGVVVDDRNYVIPLMSIDDRPNAFGAPLSSRDLYVKHQANDVSSQEIFA